MPLLDKMYDDYKESSKEKEQNKKKQKKKKGEKKSGCKKKNKKVKKKTINKKPKNFIYHTFNYLYPIGCYIFCLHIIQV